MRSELRARVNGYVNPWVAEIPPATQKYYQDVQKDKKKNVINEGS